MVVVVVDMMMKGKVFLETIEKRERGQELRWAGS